MTFCAWCADEGGGRGHVGGGGIFQVCARSYSGMTSIAPSWGLIPSPSPATGPSGDWEGELCISCGNKTVWPQFWYDRWPSHVHVKWVPRVFPPWVDSKSQVLLEPPSRALHTLRGKTDKIVSVDCGSAYRFILLLFLPTSQELFNWLILVGIRVRISKSDANDGVSLDFP